MALVACPAILVGSAWQQDTFASIDQALSGHIYPSHPCSLSLLSKPGVHRLVGFLRNPAPETWLRGSRIVQHQAKKYPWSALSCWRSISSRQGRGHTSGALHSTSTYYVHSSSLVGAAGARVTGGGVHLEQRFLQHDKQNLLRLGAPVSLSRSIIPWLDFCRRPKMLRKTPL